MEDKLTIESLRNPRIKAIARLRKARERRQAGLTLVEGFREIGRAAASGWGFREIYYCPPLFADARAGELLETLAGSGVPLYRCSEEVFRKISYRDTPDGLLALSPRVGRRLDDLSLSGKPLLLVAEGLEKPGNLGTMLRTADAAGADAVVVCGRETDLDNPNTIRASIGTLFILPVATASTEETQAWLREKGIQSLAAVPAGGRPYTEADMRAGTAIVVGAEDAGLSASWIEGADQRVSIPMLGKNDSLNVSSAAAILLYEAVRQRRASPRTAQEP